jgi:hypothetical protein
MRSQRAILGLLARARAACEPLSAAPGPLAAQEGLVQQVAPALRAFSAGPPSPGVAPAVTSVDISQEWYNRQRQTISLGNRVPDTAVGAYIAASATIVGDVDLLDRVILFSGGAGAAGARGGAAPPRCCGPSAQRGAVWGAAVRGCCRRSVQMRHRSARPASALRLRGGPAHASLAALPPRSCCRSASGTTQCCAAT